MFQASIQMILISLTVISSAHGWEQHQTVMAGILDAADQKSGSRAYLKTMVMIPSEDEQKKVIAELANTLQVNAEKIPVLKAGSQSVKALLEGSMIDEPDDGMDQDLPDAADPKNDRAWMGGKVGPTSQGFRHMVFPGIEWFSPLRTLQIPLGTIGQSPARILKLHEASQKFLQEKNLFWGLRLRLWELHFIQDLHQPFHTMQVPYIRMLPWKNLFSGFVKRSTQVISNYHFAYEGLIHDSLTEEKLSPLATCFEAAPQVSFEVNEKSIQEIIQLSRSHAYDIGNLLYQLWDVDLKNPEVNLPNHEGSLDYYSYLHANPDEEDQKLKVEQVQSLLKNTCGLMKSLTDITWAELDSAIKN